MKCSGSWKGEDFVWSSIVGCEKGLGLAVRVERLRLVGRVGGRRLVRLPACGSGKLKNRLGLCFLSFTPFLTCVLQVRASLYLHR